MKTRIIFNTLALATLLITSCSREVINNENTEKKGFEIPVTINVTRQGDDATKATYNDGTKKLSFSTGDKLFVRGNYDHWTKMFAGTLDYDAESGKFKGTIYTEDDTYKTYEDLFGHSDYTEATLLPAGYEDHGYLVINTQGTEEKYDDLLVIRNEYTLATSKAAGVEQFSYEKATSYSSGFALTPQNAILNFTITGLAASTSVNVSLTSIAYNITGTVTTDASGTATFAAGIMGELNLQPFSLTVGGKNITIVSSDKEVTAGKIYNITRSALTYPIALSAVTSSYVGSVVTTDGNVYATVAAATAATKTAAAMIAYVSDTGHGLALALADEASTMNWDTATGPSGAAAHTPIVTSYSWKLPSQTEWNYMITAAGSYTALRDGFRSFGGTNMNAGTYWSSTDAGTFYGTQLKYGYKFNEGSWGTFGSTYPQNTRACLAF